MGRRRRRNELWNSTLVKYPLGLFTCRVHSNVVYLHIQLAMLLKTSCAIEDFMLKFLTNKLQQLTRPFKGKLQLKSGGLLINAQQCYELINNQK